MKDLTQGNEYKVIVYFSLPILIGNLFQQLYNVVDSIIVGNFLGKESLAAVGISFNFISIILSLATGLTTGTSILVSSYFGAKENNNIKKAVDTGYIFSFLISVIFMIAGIIFSKEILLFLKTPRKIFSVAQIYLIIILLGVIPTFMYNTYSNILRGLGDSKTPIYYLVISAVLNTILDIVFVRYLQMGVSGAAVATVISQYFCFFGVGLHMSKKYSRYNVHIQHMNFDKDTLGLSLKIGIPAMLQQLFMSIGFVIIQRIINNFGTNYIAAYNAVSKLDAFAEMPALNIGKALSNFVAQNLGARKKERVNRGYHASLILSTVISVFFTAIIVGIPEYFIRIFTNDPDIINIGITYFRIICPFYILFSVMQITNGLLIGYGSSFVPMISTIVSFCLIQVPIAILFSGKIGITGIWIAAPIGWLVGLGIRFLFWVRIKNTR